MRFRLSCVSTIVAYCQQPQPSRTANSMPTANVGTVARAAMYMTFVVVPSARTYKRVNERTEIAVNLHMHHVYKTALVPLRRNHQAASLPRLFTFVFADSWCVRPFCRFTHVVEVSRADTRSAVQCEFFAAGLCKNGAACSFAHAATKRGSSRGGASSCSRALRDRHASRPLRLGCYGAWTI